jgi:hemoglobin-like flavoprotein
MMTRDQIELVQSSHVLLQPMATQAAALFYDKLFEREPGVGALFKGDMAAQGDKLMTMISAAVRLLDQPVKLDLALAALGARHVGYGVRDEHYAIVGGALLDTLAAALGSRFTPALREAWAALYAHVSRVMQDGSRARLAA